MQSLSCSLLALAALMTLWSQPIWGYDIKHTPIGSDLPIDSGYTYEFNTRYTVPELKEKLAEEYQAPKDMFHVLWGRNELHYRDLYNKPYEEIYIKFDSTLIKVVKPDGSYIVVGGEKKDTVASLKDKIAKKVNVPREMQGIYRNGATGELQDGEQLAKNSIFNDLSVQWKPAQVRIKFPSGEIISFGFDPSVKVASLKEKIQQAKNIARERQSLLLKGKGELDDDKLLLDLRLTKSSILTLVERDPDECEIIYVRLASKRLLTFEVSLAKDTVASLKEKISRAEGIAQEKQHLFLFKGNEMGNSRLLGDYVTKSQSVVDLLLCSDNQDGQGAVVGHHIHWEPMGEDVGLKFALNIKPNDTVASVKQAITSVNKSSTSNLTLHLFSENKKLEDNKRMLEHVLSNGSLLQLTALRNDGPEMIHVLLPSGRLVTFELDIASKVKVLKELLAQEMGANQTSRKRLFYGDQELSDDKSLYDCNVRSNFIVNLLLDQKSVRS